MKSENRDLATVIGKAFDGELEITKKEVRQAIDEAMQGLNEGRLRICSQISPGQWKTHSWLKQAILLFFRTQESRAIAAGELNFFDKIPLKKWSGREGVRVVPHALARFGSFIESGAILMPSYVNIGAFVGAGTLVDTWATVGSCAQVGKNVHLSGGVGLGGVLEPIQASPVIIEDGVFVGSRCVIVEGTVIEEGAVIGAGCVITASTKIIDVRGSSEVVSRGRVPARAVVIPGSVPKIFAAGTFGTPCALIIGERGAGTDLKTSLNEALRVIENVDG